MRGDGVSLSLFTPAERRKLQLLGPRIRGWLEAGAGGASAEQTTRHALACLAAALSLDQLGAKPFFSQVRA